MQGCQADELLERIFFGAYALHFEGHLIFDGDLVRRQKALETERDALFGGKRRVFVVDGVVEQPVTRDRDLGDLAVA